MGSRQGANANFPDRKISETFLDFAAPLLEPLGPEPTQEQFEQALKLAFVVWNGVVYDTVNGNDHYLSEIRRLIAQVPQGKAMLDHMVTRKQERFADDHRLIGEYSLRREGNEFRLRAEARIPGPTS